MTTRGIPWWEDLLQIEKVAYSNNEPTEVLERMASAASNISLAVTKGMAAIGELMWMAADNDNSEIESHTIFNIGCLNAALAELLGELALIESNAKFGKHQRELARIDGAKA